MLDTEDTDGASGDRQGGERPGGRTWLPDAGADFQDSFRIRPKSVDIYCFQVYLLVISPIINNRTLEASIEVTDGDTVRVWISLSGTRSHRPVPSGMAHYPVRTRLRRLFFIIPQTTGENHEDRILQRAYR